MLKKTALFLQDGFPNENYSIHSVALWCSSFSIIRTDGFWFVGPEAGKAFCIFMKKRVAFKAEQMQPPATGWECIIGKDTFQPDPTMECSRELTPICAGVSIGSSWLN